MSVLISDQLQKTDCDRCGVSQKQFDELCAACYFTSRANDRLEKINDEENDFAIRFWARVLAWAFCAILCGATIFLLNH